MSAINKFHNIAVLTYSVLKLLYETNEPLKKQVQFLTSNPWRAQQPNCSFQQLLIAVRLDFWRAGDFKFEESALI